MPGCPHHGGHQGDREPTRVLERRLSWTPSSEYGYINIYILRSLLWNNILISARREVWGEGYSLPLPQKIVYIF